MHVILLFWCVQFAALTVQRSLIGGTATFAFLLPRLITSGVGVLLCCGIAAALSFVGNSRWQVRLATGVALAAGCALVHAPANFAIFQLFVGDLNWRNATLAHYSAAIGLWLWTYVSAAAILLVLHYAAELRAMRELQMRAAADRQFADSAPDIWIRQRGETVRLALEDIDRISAERQYIRLFQGERSWLHRASLATISPLLDGERFIRVHRSHILARRNVAAVRRTPHGDYRVTVVTGEQFPVGRNYRAAIRALMAPPAG